MKKYMLLYKGPAAPPGASHEGWPQWFERLGEALVDIGSPMTNGSTVRSSGMVGSSEVDLNGYGIIQAEDTEAAHGLVADHPYLLADSHEYSIDVFEIPKK